MSSSDDKGKLDCILGGAELDELQAINCSQELLGIVPAPIDDAVSTVGLAPHEGRIGELRGGGP